MSEKSPEPDIKLRRANVAEVPEAHLCRSLADLSRGFSSHSAGFKKESQQFAGGIRTVRVCVSAICAAPGPGMTTPVDEPLLDHHSPGLVSGYGAGIGPASRRSDLRALHRVTCLSLDDLCGIRRMDDPIRIAMEDDGRHARGVN